jgi:hypothetical protein
MKITISKTIQETHELELPAYRKNICYYYKIVSETEAIQVCFGEYSKKQISESYTSSALSLAPELGTQEEFDTKFNEVVTVLMEKASL